jgi:hypothetical protein
VLGSPRLASPGSELTRGVHAVLEDSGIDVQATDLVRIGRPLVPGVFDAQHRAALPGGDALAQFLVPRPSRPSSAEGADQCLARCSPEYCSGTSGHAADRAR